MRLNNIYHATLLCEPVHSRLQTAYLSNCVILACLVFCLILVPTLPRHCCPALPVFTQFLSIPFPETGHMSLASSITVLCSLETELSAC